MSGFALISSFEYNRKGSMHAERLRYLEITLSEWLFRAIESAEVLTIHRDYFRLRSPLDRRLYELARKHCGAKDRWRIGIDKLQKKCGSKQERKHFVRHMRETVAGDRLPEYRVELDGDLVVFSRREGEGASANGQGTASASPVAVSAPGSASERRILVSSKAIEQLYEFAPDWDKHMLESMYIAWAKTKEPAHNEDARFHGWVKCYTKNKPAP